MTALTEIERWETEIYQLEEEDPVLGGADGIDNLQAKQLANRTLYLKTIAEAAQGGITAHTAAADPHVQYALKTYVLAKIAELVNSSPAALDTLNELATALGNDPNFATTITTALAGKQPNDPTLTAIAGLVGAADKLAYFNGADTAALTAFTAFARSMLAATDAASVRALLSAVTQADINAAVAALVASSPAALDTLNELATALGDDPNFATTITNALALKAPLASPALTGIPTAPTAAPGNSTTQLATTAFIQAAIAALSLANYAKLAIAQTFTAQQSGEIFDYGNWTGSADLFANQRNNYKLKLIGNSTFPNPTTMPAVGTSGVAVITQDATGSRTLAFGTNFKFPGGSAPALSTAANTVDVLTYYVASATQIVCNLLKAVA